jgi:hypothetical protein
MRSYAKSNPEKSASEPIPQNKSVEVVATVAIRDAGTNYKKEDGVKLPKSFFVIVSGGEKTERLYFKIISNQDKFRRIKIEFVADPNQLNPNGLLETAKYKKEHYETSRQDMPDQIFIVSDVDEFMNELLDIKPQCDDSGISLIISNCCFEVWLYYAYYEKIQGFTVPENISQISKAFRRWMPTNINPTKAIFNIHQNIQNAESHYEQDSNGIPKLFSTNMFMLSKILLPFIDTEIMKMIDENLQRIAKHSI